jgi:DNA-binding CsgD family transcriptional regulator
MELTTPSRLTDPLADVLRHIANGDSDDETATALSISIHTVRSRVAAILVRLDARNRAHAVAIALRTGEIIPVPERVDR